jgi:microcystin-dependent protein
MGINNINNKTDAINYINTRIASDDDDEPKLNPSGGFPIKYTNFSNFWINFLEYLFPTTTSDLYGKSPIFSNVDNLGNYTATNTDYSRLKYQAIVPIGGVFMYGGSGINTFTVGTIIPDPTIEGYLYCDGSVINMNIPGNKKYEKLRDIIGQSFHNPNNPSHGQTKQNGLLYLPDYRSKTLVGYNVGASDTGYVDPTGVDGIVDNAGKIGNTGGADTYTITVANLPAIPDHKHVLNSNPDATLTITPTQTSSDGGHSHALKYGNGQSWVIMSSADGTQTNTYSTRVAGTTGDTAAYIVDYDDPSSPNRKGIGWGESGAITHILYSRTKTSGVHNHDVIDAKGDLKGRTVGVKSYTKTATPINMRSAYLVTNFIIKY